MDWEQHQTKISMDGRGRALDNIFTERLWRNVKYEEVYLKDYDTVRSAATNLNNYFISTTPSVRTKALITERLMKCILPLINKNKNRAYPPLLEPPERTGMPD
jgi:hypothetical protein